MLLQMLPFNPDGGLMQAVKKLRAFANEQITPKAGGKRIVNSTGRPTRLIDRQFHALSTQGFVDGEKYIPADPGEIPFEATLNSGFVQDTLIPILGRPLGGISADELDIGIAGKYDHRNNEAIISARLFDEGRFANVLTHELAHGMQDRYLSAAFQDSWVGHGTRSQEDFTPFGRGIGTADRADAMFEQRRAAGGSEAQAEALSNALEVFRQYQNQTYDDQLAHLYRLTPEDNVYGYTGQGARDALDFWYNHLQRPRWRRDRP